MDYAEQKYQDNVIFTAGVIFCLAVALFAIYGKPIAQFIIVGGVIVAAVVYYAVIEGVKTMAGGRRGRGWCITVVHGNPEWISRI